MRISVAPASASVPTSPATARLADADEVVAGPGHDVDRVETDPGHPVCEGGDGARSAHRIDLVDIEQAGSREDRRVNPTAVLPLRRRCECHLRDAGDLRRDDVHDHAGRIHRLAAGDVETDAPHRLPPLVDVGAGAELGHTRRRHLRRRGCANPFDRCFQRGAHGRVEGVERFVEVGCRHPDGVVRHAVEALRLLTQRRLAVRGDVGHELRGDRERRLAVGGGTRHGRKQFCGREHSPAQVDRPKHPSTLARRAPAGRRIRPGPATTRHLSRA